MSLRIDALRLSRELDRFPGTLLGVCLALLGVSLVALHSASLTPTGGSLGYAAKQAGWAVLGLAGFFACSQVPYDRLGRRAWTFMGLGCAALVLVLLVGTKVNGARSWFSLGPVRLQPSEFVKYALVLLLARTVARRGAGIGTWRGLAEAGAITALPAGLVLLQPDLGTALTYAPILVSIVFVAGARLRHLLAVAAAGLASLPLLWCFFLKEYQKLRILSFLDSNEHALGGAYQVNQSVIAVGSGGLLGRGFGQGTQGPLGFLPERHTDFIYAVVCEDFGLVGGVILLALYGHLLAALLEIVRTTRDPEGRFIVIGVGAVTLVQIIINVGMVLGAMPVTGLPLPLVSYGGSSLVATLCGFGLCASVARHRTRVIVHGSEEGAAARR
ncbi:MAG: rod shape-determining protein RodA [Planctomycetes bacterium]|nr:rod shape-determining protein RodA [Planctomycetota bacterium]